MTDGPRDFKSLEGRTLFSVRLDISSLRSAIKTGRRQEIERRRSRLLTKLQRLKVDPTTLPGATELFPDFEPPTRLSQPEARGPRLFKSMTARYDPDLPEARVGKRTVTLYHVTSKESAAEIVRTGRFEAGRANQFQGFESQVQGLYGWATRERAQFALGQLGLDPEDLADFAVLRVDLPLDEFESRLRPDEDWSLERGEWRNSYTQLQSVAVEGDVEARHISEVYSDDKSVRRAVKAAGRSPATDPKVLASLPTGARTVNEEFFDALVRHQIGLLRLSGSTRDKVHKLLDATEKDMAALIRRRLAGARGLEAPADVRRLQTLLKSIRATRLRAWDQVTETWVEELREIARAEPAAIDGMLKTVSPVVLETTLPSVSLLDSIVQTRPFDGKTLRSWASSIRQADISRIEDQIRIGLVQGESSDAIARRVVGTARLRGRNGVTEITRRQAAGITRTAVNAFTNQAKREFYRANADVFEEELYTATLDARTTRVCSSLDGETFPVGEGPIPPLHFNCRSLRVAVIDGQVIGSRPARAFTQRQLLREFTDDRGIARVTTRAALPRGTRGAFDSFAAGRMRELTGRVPAKVSYQQWLGRQSAAFQDDVLGQARGRLFRRGGLTLDRFVNRSGDELSLSQLARRDRDAFIRAGLDPEEFL